jgi:signal transduction histidine kinase
VTISADRPATRRGWRTALQRPRYDSGIPVDTLGDATLTAIHPLLCLALVITCLISVHPLGGNGWGLVGLVLIGVNGLLMLTRTMPDAWFGDRGRLAVATMSALAAGFVWGFDPASWAEAFGFTLAVHAGIRFETRQATGIAALASVTAMVSVALRTDRADLPPWWFGAFIFLAVAVGMLRRSRRRALAAAHELVVQTRRAAAGEAKAQVLADRAELARDLHDVLAHSLSGVNMQLSMADALFEAGREDDGLGAVRRAQGMVVDGLAEARRAMSLLRTGTLDLEPTLAAMVTGEHEAFRSEGGPPHLDGAATRVAVRVAQEALTNARRHAAGAAVAMTLGTDPDAVRLVVENEAPTEHVASGESGSGLGLVGMRERATSVGADLVTGPVTEGAYAGGWRVALTLPLDESA